MQQLKYGIMQIVVNIFTLFRKINQTQTLMVCYLPDMWWFVCRKKRGLQSFALGILEFLQSLMWHRGTSKSQKNWKTSKIEGQTMSTTTRGQMVWQCSGLQWWILWLVKHLVTLTMINKTLPGRWLSRLFKWSESSLLKTVINSRSFKYYLTRCEVI